MVHGKIFLDRVLAGELVPVVTLDLVFLVGFLAALPTELQCHQHHHFEYI